jgi:hypothetical protein
VANEVLYTADLGVILLASIVFFLGVTETGFRLGRRSRPGVNADSRSEISTLQGALLGLLALLLGFTFAMAMSRFETRKQLVLEESNAIGTTFLRAQLLPEPPRQEISNLLRQYVDVRLAFYEANIDPQKLRQANDRTEQLHKQLWSLTAALGAKDPRAVTTGLFLQSLNEVIDLHAKRITAMENHVPEIILVLLYFVALTVTGLMGYGSGLGGRRNFLVTLMASILIAAVILVIIDLDRPRRGLIRISQQRLVELRDSLAKY